MIGEMKFEKLFKAINLSKLDFKYSERKERNQELYAINLSKLDFKFFINRKIKLFILL